MIGLSKTALAQTSPYSSIQSSARPFNLNIVDKVKRWDADTKSQDFHKTSLPSLRQSALQNLRESTPLTGDIVGLHKIDPNKIFLKTQADVRCYFVGEGAGYHNTLGFNTGFGTIAQNSSAKLIFPDASTNVAESNLAGTGTRSLSAPLLPGDFTDMGHFGNNTQLNFFVVADGANSGRNVFSTEHALNKDGIVHAVAYTVPNSPYLLIGFEDLYGGGDRDYNDLLYTIDIGRGNVERLSGPEPATWAVLLALLGLALVPLRRPAMATSLIGKGA